MGHHFIESMNLHYRNLQVSVRDPWSSSDRVSPPPARQCTAPGADGASGVTARRIVREPDTRLGTECAPTRYHPIGECVTQNSPINSIGGPRLLNLLIIAGSMKNPFLSSHFNLLNRPFQWFLLHGSFVRSACLLLLHSLREASGRQLGRMDGMVAV